MTAILFLLYGVTFVLYYFYNKYLFSFTSHVLSLSVPRWKTDTVAFIFNSLMFVGMSVTRLPLVVNWTLIGIAFVLEVKLILHASWREGALVAIIGASVGLASNIAMRTACAIALDVPLSAVNNNLGMLRVLPVALGFLVAAIIMYGVDRRTNHRALGTVFSERRVTKFLLAAMPLCYLYLCSSLLLYYNDLNSIVIKLWNMKSALFVAFAESTAIWFAYRLASTLTQAKRREALRREVAESEQANARMLELAERDMLTGCFNRSYIQRKLAELLDEGLPCQVVFVDVDNLKLVNDRFGHEAGDAYIASVADALDQVRASAADAVARYGGDEFLVVLAKPATATDLAERMATVMVALEESARDKDLLFIPSASWGAADSQPGDDVQSLVTRADAAMYRSKSRKGVLRELAS